MMAIPVTFASNNRLDNRLILIDRLLWCIDNLVNVTVHSAWRKSFETLHESKAKVERHISNEIPVAGCDPNTPKNEQKMKSTIQDSPNAADQTSELLNFISETKVSFAETLHSLNLFEKYLESPSEEIAKQLELWFNREKGKEFLTQEKIDKLLDFVINECSQDGNNENKGPEDFDKESSDSENKTYVLDAKSDCVSSISQEALQRDLEKERTPLSPSEQREKEQCNDHEDLGIDKERHRLEGLMEDTESLMEDTESLMESRRVKKLEDKNISLQNKLKLLRIENREILAELGEITVEKTAKESEGRKSELFQRIYRSPCPKAKRYTVSACNERPIDHRLGYPNACQSGYEKSAHVNVHGSTSNGSPNGSQKPQTKNESANPPPENASVVYTATPCEQPFLGAEALVQERNHQPGKEKVVTSAKDESEFQAGDQDNTHAASYRSGSENQNSTMQTLLSITSKEKTSGGEGSKSRRNEVKGTSDLASTSRDEGNSQSSTQQSYESLSFPVQQDDSNGREFISLGNIPPTSVATTLYNNYKFLLLSLGQRLLSSDVVKLKDWANQNFSIENAQNATDVLFQLDGKGVINAEDLNQLCHFFVSIVRYDLVYIIDAFLLGDYSLLRQIPASKNRDANRPQNPQHGTTSRYPSLFNAANSRQSSVSSAASGTLGNPATSRKPQNSNGPQSSVAQQTQQAANFSSFSALPNTTNPKHFSRSPNENQSAVHEQQNLKPFATEFTPTRMSEVVVADGPVTNERRTMRENYLTRTNQSMTNNARNTQTVGSNGLKLSKFQRPNTERSNVSNSQSPGTSRNQQALDQDGNWLCSHYKRHCYVKFECCDKFWPCHRCHNNQSTCGRKKLKSRDTKMVKCVYCNKAQQFGEFCCDCGAKFANYFCGLCKHLTGEDDHPYHCDKCGICRIHGDRSFHCDICGVCLDVQLRGNHKCREGSAHDECCICLEDAFTGCQILPCSHKVHKECATQMIRSGITRCPICRESFAHKLERRPLSNSGKRSGK